MLNKMSNSYQNVHQYDGSISMPCLPKLSKDEKLLKINALLTKLTNKNAINMMNVIINSLTSDTPSVHSNYDEINHIDVTDIISAILNKQYDALLDVIEEQLVDMWTLGQCAQGRTIRFIQIYQSLE